MAFMPKPAASFPQLDAKSHVWDKGQHDSPFDHLKQGWCEAGRCTNRSKSRRYAIGYRCVPLPSGRLNRLNDQEEDGADLHDHHGHGAPGGPAIGDGEDGKQLPVQASESELKGEPHAEDLPQAADLPHAADAEGDSEDFVICPTAESLRLRGLQPCQVQLQVVCWNLDTDDWMNIGGQLHLGCNVTYSCEREAFKYPQTALRVNADRLIEGIVASCALLDGGSDEGIRQWLIELLYDAEALYLTERGDAIRRCMQRTLPISHEEERKHRDDSVLVLATTATTLTAFCYVPWFRVIALPLYLFLMAQYTKHKL